jgi:uncharacterized membrane protein YeiH
LPRDDRFRGVDNKPVGLALFTAMGCNVALDLNLPFLIVIMSGIITGCIGWLLRDVLCNDVPLLFRSELYASVSVVAGALSSAAFALASRTIR